MAEIRDYIIGIIVFMFFIVGGVSLIASMREKDSTFGNDDKFQQFNSSFSKLDTIQNRVSGIENSTKVIDEGNFGFFDFLIGNAWSTLTLTFSSFSFMTDIFSATSTIFGIPTWIPLIIGLLITIFIAFAIFSAIFQRDL
jgi:hypothetical protein